MTPLELKVTHVALQEDRAFVTRSGRWKLEAGIQRCRIVGVSPVISDKSLGASLGDVGDATLVELRVTRHPRKAAEGPDPETMVLRERLEEEQARLTASKGELERLEQSLSAHQALLGRWLTEIAADAAGGYSAQEEWTSDLGLLESRIVGLGERGVEARVRLEIEGLLVRDLQNQFQHRQQPSTELEACLELTVLCAEAGEVEVTVEYCVPNACWRPYHVAEWLGDKLRFRTEACLWQNTGEDWSGVQLSFGTQRAALGTEAPTLDRDVLYLQTKQKKTSVETREDGVQRVEERIQKVPGIDDGGSPLRFSAQMACDVPSDGRPHRVPLFEFEGPLSEERILMGELDSSVFVRTKAVNPTKESLLAGPVDLIRDCGLVGRSYLEYVTAGDSFEVNWGPHPELRCHREETTSSEESSILTGWRTKTHQVDIHLSNLGLSPQKLEVRERIPVSEIKGVKVEQNLKKTTGKAAHNEHGFVTWSLELPAYGHQTLTLEYQVSRKKDVEGI